MKYSIAIILTILSAVVALVPAKSASGRNTQALKAQPAFMAFFAPAKQEKATGKKVVAKKVAPKKVSPSQSKTGLFGAKAAAPTKNATPSKGFVWGQPKATATSKTSVKAATGTTAKKVIVVKKADTKKTVGKVGPMKSGAAKQMKW